MADPAGRELMISCGAAVFTLRVALRYLGWLPRARLFPEPDFPGRDFAAGHDWGLAAPAAGERSAGVVCLLATSANEPADW